MSITRRVFIEACIWLCILSMLIIGVASMYRAFILKIDTVSRRGGSESWHSREIAIHRCNLTIESSGRTAPYARGSESRSWDVSVSKSRPTQGWRSQLAFNFAGFTKRSRFERGVVQGDPSSFSASTQYQVPLWPLLLLLGIYPAKHLLAALGGTRAKRRWSAGLCPRCGYDLRETPERCPECGEAPKIDVYHPSLI